MTERRRDQESYRTGEYGGDDGALEHEREAITPGEDTGTTGTPTGGAGGSAASQAERKQADDLAKGEENPA